MSEDEKRIHKQFSKIYRIHSSYTLDQYMQRVRRFRAWRELQGRSEDYRVVMKHIEARIRMVCQKRTLYYINKWLWGVKEYETWDDMDTMPPWHLDNGEVIHEPYDRRARMEVHSKSS